MKEVNELLRVDHIRVAGLPVTSSPGIGEVNIRLWMQLQDDFEAGVGDITYAVSTPLWDYLFDEDVILL